MADDSDAGLLDDSNRADFAKELPVYADAPPMTTTAPVAHDYPEGELAR